MYTLEFPLQSSIGKKKRANSLSILDGKNSSSDIWNTRIEDNDDGCIIGKLQPRLPIFFKKKNNCYPDVAITMIFTENSHSFSP